MRAHTLSRHTLLLFAVAIVISVGVAVPAAHAAGEAGPQWTVTSVSRPTNLTPGDLSGQDGYVVRVTNTGGESSNGEAITITDELPQPLSFATGVSAEDELAGFHKSAGANFAKACGVSGNGSFSCTYTGVVVPDDTLILRIPVAVPADTPSSLTNVVRVSGGGAPSAAMSTITTISAEPASFGLSAGGASTALSTLQAGAHPDLTTSLAFNTLNPGGALAGDFKDTTDELPPGFAGDLPDTATCPPAVFLQQECPIDTQVGVTTLSVVGVRSGIFIEPLYNLTPGPGEAAKLGFVVAGNLFFQGDVSVRPGDYGLQTSFYNADQGDDEVDNVTLTVWGVPGDPIHDPLRFKSNGNKTGLGEFGAPSEAAPAPFLTNPTACGNGRLTASFSANSWQQPAQFVSAPMEFGPFVGCDRLDMSPSLSAQATTDKAYSPTGLDVNLTVPQTYNNAYGLASSTLERAVVTLPEGMTVNPSAGVGLAACTPAQYAQEGVQYIPGQGCPNESKLGTVRILTPSLKEEITGSVYLAQPYDNPFGSLLALYIVARGPERGILVRTAGEVSADPLSGRLVTTFDTADVATPHGGLPPVPFSLFTFRFNQGQTSPLVTPPSCGDYTVQAQLTPWTNLAQSLTPEIAPFPITSGFAGGACPPGGVPPFAPQLSAGTQTNGAGSYAPLDLEITRGDGEQEITGFSSLLPSGLTANLSGVPFCGEAEIALARSKTGADEEGNPSCPAGSQIGHSSVGAGVGSVLAYAPGKLYMGGPFEGDPFSIVSITSAKVGPFDLGTVVVHLPLLIDPVTAAVSVGAGAADQIPHIVKGIVVHVRDIRVYVDRPDFTINPTSCEHLNFAATVIGSGADFVSPADDVPVQVTAPYQAADCQNLHFKPTFKVSTSGKTSRKNGASLSVKLTYPNAPQGTQANIRSVKVDLPKQLPSNLKTLQKACPADVFNANPANCSVGSRVGRATAITPILPVRLTGPAYFVSYGGAKFPELVIVLQGYGVTIELHGETYINEKTGVTSSTFRTVPDQPVTSFALTLPEGSNSALDANTNLCKVKGGLKMPTALTAQNGATIKQTTPIALTGCPRDKRAPGKAKHKNKSK